MTKNKRISQYQKIHTLFEYLRKNTDADHRVKQQDLRNDNELEGVIGHYSIVIE